VSYSPRVKTLAVCFVNGMAAARISPEMRKQQIGSASCVPQIFIQSDEIMTATLPRVSARMCR